MKSHCWLEVPLIGDGGRPDMAVVVNLDVRQQSIKLYAIIVLHNMYDLQPYYCFHWFRNNHHTALFIHAMLII